MMMILLVQQRLSGMHMLRNLILSTFFTQTSLITKEAGFVAFFQKSIISSLACKLNDCVGRMDSDAFGAPVLSRGGVRAYSDS